MPLQIDTPRQLNAVALVQIVLLFHIKIRRKENNNQS